MSLTDQIECRWLTSNWSRGAGASSIDASHYPNLSLASPTELRDDGYASEGSSEFEEGGWKTNVRWGKTCYKCHVKIPSSRLEALFAKILRRHTYTRIVLGMRFRKMFVNRTSYNLQHPHHISPTTLCGQVLLSNIDQDCHIWLFLHGKC